MTTRTPLLLGALLALPACVADTADEPGSPSFQDAPTSTLAPDDEPPPEHPFGDFAAPGGDFLLGPDTDGDGTHDPLDCAPLDPAVYPGAPEVRDGVDQNCDGVADEGLGDNYDLHAAQGFNVFVFGDLVSGVDITGRAAAGNAVLLAGFAVGQADPGGDALVAGGDLDLEDGTVYGDAWFGDTAGVSNVNFVGGALQQGAPVDFAASEAELTAVSQGLAALPTNCATVVQPWGAIELLGFDPAQNVCSVDTADLAWAPLLSVDAPSGSTVLINVVGGDLELANVGLTVLGTDPARVLWNAPDAALASLSSLGFQGSLLAPGASVQFDNGSFDGQLIAAGLAGSGEPHHAPFDGDLFFGCGPVEPPVEICDGLDNDGDGLVDEGFDTDADGFTSCGGDCDDADDQSHPGAPEYCDGVDTDCDGDLDNDACVAPPAAATARWTRRRCRLAPTPRCTRRSRPRPTCWPGSQTRSRRWTCAGISTWAAPTSPSRPAATCSPATTGLWWASSTSTSRP